MKDDSHAFRTAAAVPAYIIRNAAAAAGLAYINCSIGVDWFGHNFGLSCGNLIGMPEPHKVKALVELAYRLHVEKIVIGEHIALLALTADEAYVEAFEAGQIEILSWRNAPASGNEHISLREWLAANGQVPEIGVDAYWDTHTPLRHEFPGEVLAENRVIAHSIFGDLSVDADRVTEFDVD